MDTFLSRCEHLTARPKAVSPPTHKGPYPHETDHGIAGWLGCWRLTSHDVNKIPSVPNPAWLEEKSSQVILQLALLSNALSTGTVHRLDTISIYDCDQKKAHQPLLINAPQQLA